MRPHDIRVGRDPELAIAGNDRTAESTGVIRATIDRVVYLGFEVRVELTSATTGSPFTAQITAVTPRRSGWGTVTPSMSGRPDTADRGRFSGRGARRDGLIEPIQYGPGDRTV